MSISDKACLNKPCASVVSARAKALNSSSPLNLLAISACLSASLCFASSPPITAPRIAPKTIPIGPNSTRPIAAPMAPPVRAPVEAESFCAASFCFSTISFCSLANS